METRTIVLSANSAWNVANFRGGLVRELLNAGYRVVVLASSDRHVDRVRALGCEWISLNINAHGLNPVDELRVFARYFQELRRLRPVAFLGFTIKPNIYGSLAARLLRIPVFNNVSGLGATFLRGGWLRFVTKCLYRVAFSSSHRVFFQNEDDQALFVQEGLVHSAQSSLLPGSGVDLVRFSPGSAAGPHGRPMVILMAARMLWDKGVREFVAAVRTLKERGIECDARLLGFVDAANPSAVPREQIAEWQREGVVTYFGEVDDVRPMISDADVVVLPSYREGTPRSLLEALAMGKPVVTTDAPGCRNVVAEGVNGYVVPVRNSVAIADALFRFACLSYDQQIAMGMASREVAELRYDERLVIGAYLKGLEELPPRAAKGL